MGLRVAIFIASIPVWRWSLLRSLWRTMSMSARRLTADTRLSWTATARDHIDSDPTHHEGISCNDCTHFARIWMKHRFFEFFRWWQVAQLETNCFHAKALTLPKAVQEVKTISRIYGGRARICQLPALPALSTSRLCRLASDPDLHPGAGRSLSSSNMFQVSRLAK